MNSTVSAPRGPRPRVNPPRSYRRPPAWHALGACATADPDSWYPEQDKPSKAVLRVCAGCPVRDLCLDQAITDDEQHGIWGGLNPAERRTLTRTATGSERAA
jgi:WhiB family redox-sensing transcriptional regulator